MKVVESCRVQRSPSMVRRVSPRRTVSGNDGSYSFADLPPGGYTVRASAPGLTLRQAAKTTLRAGSQILNLQLSVAAEKQEVTVEESGAPAVSTDAASNTSATVL